MVMRHTGKVYQTVFGEIDASKGTFHKGNISAGRSYFVGFEKVKPYTKKLVADLKNNMKQARSVEERLMLSFTGHFDLVSIHPFYDGNG